MEEFIGFGFIGLLMVCLILVTKRLFTKKKDLYKYEDEIILDDMAHYGPFSGNFKNPCQKLVILLAVSSSFLQANIELRTIDNWGISSWGQETLMLQKTSDDTNSNLFIGMERPFCICTDPLIITPPGKTNFNVGDKIEAVMIVDNYKPKDIVFNVADISDDGSYLLRPKYYPGLSNAQIIKIKFAQATKMNNMLFNTKGMSNAMKQSERICLSHYDLMDEEIQDTNRI